MKTNVKTLKSLIKEIVAETKKVEATIEYGHFGASIFLSDGRQLDIEDLTEKLLPFNDEIDEQWHVFNQAVTIEALKQAGVTHVSDDGEPFVTLDAYARESTQATVPLSKENKKLLLSSLPMIAQYVKNV